MIQKYAAYGNDKRLDKITASVVIEIIKEQYL